MTPTVVVLLAVLGTTLTINVSQASMIRRLRMTTKRRNLLVDAVTNELEQYRRQMTAGPYHPAVEKTATELVDALDDLDPAAASAYLGVNGHPIDWLDRTVVITEPHDRPAA